MLKKILPLTLCFVFLLTIPVYADIPERTQANSEIERLHEISDFYPEQIGTPAGSKSINYISYKAVDSATGGDSTYTLLDPPEIFAYGEPWGYNPRFGVDRYAGYTVQGHPLNSPDHPFDSWSGGLYDEKLKETGIFHPWEDDDVKKYIIRELGLSEDEVKISLGLPHEDLQRKEKWRGHFMWGLLFDQYNGEYIIDPKKNPDIPWEDYVYVYHPPTDNSWGWGRIFREENGSIFYKSVWIPNHIPSVPDFFPTPEGATEWQEEFSACARTFIGQPGEEVTFSVTLRNQGESCATDFRAVWEGQGDDPVKGWAGSNPPWKTETDVIELEKKGSQTFEVTIPFPASGEPNKLYFKANIDGNTPAYELNQDNNIMAVVFKPPGVDLKITGHPQKKEIELYNTIEMAGVVLYTITRKDDGTEPVPAVLTMHGPSGDKKETVIVKNKPLTRSYIHQTNRPGEYNFWAEVWPSESEEIHPPDNTTGKIKIRFFKREYPLLDPGRQDGDTNLEVGLTG